MKNAITAISFILLGSVFASGADLERIAQARLGCEPISRAWTSKDARVGVFNRAGGGYAIITDAGVIGYSDSDAFNPSKAPAALLEILEHSRPDAKRIERRGTYTPVEPLLGAIAWDQTDPYNLLCPFYFGKQRAATGCAATAMAQIMRYYKYPMQGQGSNSYVPDNASIGELSVDFSSSVYDWNLMRPVYNAYSTEEEKMAVAKLMYDAGVAIGMNYGAVSGAMSDDWPAALVKYFGYDAGVALLYRSYFDIDEWERIIRTEISEGRPVYVTGFTDAGGHAFVFDGFDTDGLVHVNWGWSGMSNGYFDTTWLTPSTQGTGGSNGGFNSRQLIVTRIAPPYEGAEAAVSLVSEECLTATPSRVACDGEVTVRLNGKIDNVGWQSSTVDFGLLLLDSAGDTVNVYAGPEDVMVVPGESYRNLNYGTFDLGSLDDGEYRLYPVAKATGGRRWERVRDRDLTFPNYLTLAVSDGMAVFAEAEMPQLEVTDITVQGTLFSGLKGRVIATVRNAGGTEYMGTLAAALLDATTGKRIETAETFVYDIMPGESADLDVTATFTSEPGTYKLTIVDKTNLSVGSPVEVELQAAASAAIEALSAPDFGNNNEVNPLAVRATAKVSTPEGSVFSGHLFLYIYDTDGETVKGCLGPEFVQLTDAGSPVEVAFTGRFENGEPGKEYDAVLVNGEDFTYVKPREAATTRFRVAGSTGAWQVEVDNVPVQYYTLQGLPLAEEPAHGYYIEVKGGNAQIKRR